MEWTFRLLLLSNLLFIFGAAEVQYMIVMPKKVSVGQQCDVLIQMLEGFPSSTKFTVSMKGQSVSRSATSQGEKEVMIRVPIPPNLPVTKKYQITVTGEDTSSQNQLFTNSTEITVVPTKSAIMIQTDKGIYKPSQTVHFRVINIDADLKVTKPKVTMLISDAKGNKLKQWKNEESDTGVITKDFEISDKPPLGNWSLTAKVNDEEQSVKILVEEYVLPRFEVNVIVPASFYSGQPTFKVVIEAKYTYGKGVNGKGHVMVQKEHHRAFDMVDGKASVSYQTSELNVNDGTSLTFTAYVKDETDLELEGTGQTVFYSNEHKVTCLESTDKMYYPGIPFAFAIKVSDQTGLPMPSLKDKDLTIEYNFGGSGEKKSFVIPANGVVKGNIDVPLKASRFSLRAIVNKVSVFCSSQRYQSTSKAAVKIEAVTSGTEMATGARPTFKAGNVATFKVTSNRAVNTLFYQILSRGKISTSGVEDMAGQTTKTFDVSMTSEMAPYARIIVSYFDSNEIIMSKMDLDVDGAFKNNVKVSFSDARKRAGQSVTIKVEADADSYVGVMAVDKSVELMKEGNDFDQPRVLKVLTEFSSFSDEEVYSYGGKGSGNFIENAGLVYMTSAHVLTTSSSHWGPVDGVWLEKAVDSPVSGPGSNGNVEKPMAEVTHVRKLFPETWLWTDSRVQPGNSEVLITKTVPDTITSWLASAFAVNSQTGLGVAPIRAKLEAFQPFFIVLNLPYAIVRGEQFTLKAVVFNYLGKDVDVEITLAKSNSFHVRKIDIEKNKIEEKESSQEVITNIKVEDGKTGEAVFLIAPKKLGEISIDVTAKSIVESDRLKKTVIVKPEGTTKYFSKGLFFKMDSVGEMTKKVEILVPPTGVVAGSKRVEASVAGDIMGPALNGLDKLLRVPYGCGEQNMITTAPNVFVSKYLKTMGRLTTEIKEKAVKNINSGYQRELNYKHDNGSFSAFGKSDKSGSSWLTAFVMKSFEHAMFVDASIIDRDLCIEAFKWLMSDQVRMSDGSFNEPGKVLHQEMLGGSNEGKVSLTAFIFIALLETNQCDNQVNFRAKLDTTKAFLEGKANSINDHYTLSILAYALSLDNSMVAGTVMDKLFAEATTEEGGGLYWPSKRMKDSVENFNQKRGDHIWCPPPQPEPTSIETAAYVLLACANSDNRIDQGRNILKWLLTQRNALGGYSSTQDTVLALQSQSDFAQKVKDDNPISMNVQVKSVSSAYKNDFTKITPDNSMITQKDTLPSDVKELIITGKGTGVALVQVSWQYNVKEMENTVPNNPNLKLTVTHKKIDENVIEIEPCMLYDGENPVGMSTLKVSLPSGYQADLSSLDGQADIMKKEMDGEDVVMYYNEVTTTKLCPRLKATRVFPVSDLKKSDVEAKVYYTPEILTVSSYQVESKQALTFCDICIVDCGKACATTGAQQVTFTFTTLLSIVFLSLTMKHILFA